MAEVYRGEWHLWADASDARKSDTYKPLDVSVITTVRVYENARRDP